MYTCTFCLQQIPAEQTHRDHLNTSGWREVRRHTGCGGPIEPENYVPKEAEFSPYTAPERFEPARAHY